MSVPTPNLDAAREALERAGYDVVERGTVERLRAGIVRAADALVENNRDEAYHQLYALADPTFSVLHNPFEKWRALLPEEWERRHDCEHWRMEGIGCANCNPIARELRTAPNLGALANEWEARAASLDNVDRSYRPAHVRALLYRECAAQLRSWVGGMDNGN